MFKKLKEYYEKYGGYFLDLWYYIFIFLVIVIATIIAL